jgi:hypothetical protein
VGASVWLYMEQAAVIDYRSVPRVILSAGPGDNIWIYMRRETIDNKTYYVYIERDSKREIRLTRSDLILYK